MKKFVAWLNDHYSKIRHKVHTWWRNSQRLKILERLKGLKKQLDKFNLRGRWEKICIHHRMALVFTVGIIEVIFFYFYWSDLIKHFRMDSEEEVPAWLGSFITALVAAPIAFCVWSFRDADKSKDLQHKREDLQQAQKNLQYTEESIRQADFHKIEEWATTFPPVKAPETELTAKEKLIVVGATTNKTESQTGVDNSHLAKSRPDKIPGGALQVAAIYQLLPYLKGEYGERFVRPTMEIYRSLLAAWQWGEEERTLARKSESYKITKPAYITAIHAIFRQEAAFFRVCHELPISKRSHWIPLREIDLKGINLVEVDLEGADLSRARFEEAVLTEAILKEVNFNWAHLEGAYLYGVDLKRANLTNANFKGAYLMEADLEGADLVGANLVGASLLGTTLEEANLRSADLKGANLFKANLEGADLRGADLRGAIFDQKAIDRAITDENTQFGEVP